MDFLRSRHPLLGIVAIGLAETDRGVEHDVQVVALVSNALDPVIDVGRSRDRLVDRIAEILKELSQFVVHERIIRGQGSGVRDQRAGIGN